MEERNNEEKEVDKNSIGYKLGTTLGSLLIGGAICIIAVATVKILSWLWML